MILPPRSLAAAPTKDGSMNLVQVRQWLASRRLKSLLPKRAAKPRSGKKPLRVEHLENRLVLSTINWTGGEGTSSWHDAGNWDSNTVPTANDDVVIEWTDINAPQPNVNI